MSPLPVDLAPMPPELRPTRWVACWLVDDAGHWSEALFADRELALAYAAAHRGVVVPMANLGPWPEGVR